MNLLGSILILQIASTFSYGQPQQSKVIAPRASPEALVQSLYWQVLAHPPYGDLERREMRTFAPYLSKSLLHRIQLAHACARDWYRQNPKLDNKAPFAWSESGPFTGANERESPGEFQIEKIQAEKDGSFRIDVKLTHKPIHGTGSWHVEDIVVREDGQFVLDEVIFLKDEAMEREYRLSEILTEGCEGQRWVGDKVQH